MKVLLDINGELYDLWEFRSVQRGERYNDVREEMDYLICVNKNAIATNYNDLELRFDTLQEREAKLAEIKSKLDEQDTIMII